MSTATTFVAKIGAWVLAIIALIVTLFLGYEQYEIGTCLEFQANDTTVSYEQYFSCAQYEIFLPVGETI